MAHRFGGSPWVCGSPEVKIDSFRMCSGCGCMGSLMQAAQPHCSVVVESSQLEVLVPVESWPRWVLRLRLRGVYPDEFTTT